MRVFIENRLVEFGEILQYFNQVEIKLTNMLVKFFKDHLVQDTLLTIILLFFLLFMWSY